MAGLGFSITHELVHRRNLVLRGLGVLLLWASCYPHFLVEHLYGHHRDVGTRRDSATAFFGESLYRFLLRGPVYGFINAFRLKPHLNSALWGIQLLLFLLIYLAWGPVACAWMLAQSVCGVLVLETANYIEHYGLTRRELRPGVYEPVMPEHSWNSHYFLSNASLCNLGSHADHHARPMVEFQRLCPMHQGRVMPYGFTAMLLMATLPPLWFRVMNPRCTAK
jgi:alkane 1-monooxygenase